MSSLQDALTGLEGIYFGATQDKRRVKGKEYWGGMGGNEGITKGRG